MNFASGCGQRWIVLVILLFAAFNIRGSAQANDGAAIYKKQCALCHDNSAMTRAPSPAALKMMSPENVLRALETGRMKDQGQLLNATQKRTISEFVTGKTFGQEKQTLTTPQAGLCPSAKAAFVFGPNDWNGWSPATDNARFQPGDHAQLTAEQVP